MAESTRVSARVQRIVDRCRGGERLCKTYRQKATGETEVLFCFEPSGRRAAPASAAQAIESGLLRPLGDGLLGEESSQSWAA